MGWELGLPTGEVVRLVGTATIGRAPINQIVLNDTLASRRHAELRCEGNVLIIRDLNSTNGTFLNEVPLTAPRTVQPGDILRIGSTIMQLRWVGEETVLIDSQLAQTGQMGTRPGMGQSPPSPHLGEAVRRPVLPKPAQVLYAPEPRNFWSDLIQTISEALKK
jgi:pSer/pThr/pTyr-binding forkhead associated (FHA) protein